MEVIFSSEFGRAFFTLGTVVVTGIVWYGYYKDSFSPWFTWLTVLVLVGYMVAFLLYRYLIGHVDEHMARESSYVFIAAVHGIVSLAAIVQASYMFTVAERAYARNDNYFRMHKKATLVLVLLWPLALLSGLLL